jgi:PAS domain S-box-containing protein
MGPLHYNLVGKGVILLQKVPKSRRLGRLKERYLLVYLGLLEIMMNRTTVLLTVMLLCVLLLGGLVFYELMCLNASDLAKHADVVELRDRLNALAVACIPLTLLLSGASVYFYRMARGQQDALQQAAKSLNALANLNAERVNKQSSADAIQQACDALGLIISESRRKEKFLIEKAVDVVCVIDRQAQIISVSKACKRAWGYEPDELRDHPLRLILAGESADRSIEQVLGAPKSIEIVTFQSQLRCKDGRLLDVLWTGHWSASESGLFCIVTDISEQKQAEKEARQSEQKLRTTLEALPIGVIAADAAGNVYFANSASHVMLGWSSGELAGKLVSQVFADERFAAERQSKNELSFESNASTKSGGTIPVEVRCSRIELSGEPRELFAFRDISSERELERVKREFIAMVTHDLRSPLQSVHYLLVALEEGILGTMSPDGVRFARKVEKECNRMTRLLNDMLEIEKIDSGNFTLMCNAVNVRETTLHAVEVVRALADERRLRLEASLDDVVCWADEQRVMQVMNNLLSNSIKYSPEGAVIKVAVQANEHEAVIRITDEGCGVPPQKIAKIFDKFVQVQSDDASNYGGAGLGLAICKAIVEQHGGAIGVDSKIGEGSSFWFTLPRSNGNKEGHGETTSN